MKMTEDFKSEDLLFMMKKINLKLSAQMELRLKRKDITGVQVYFLVYILRHHPKGTYLTELYHEIGVSKPTLSALIKKMAEKEYLSFHADTDDVRKKKVLPTEKLVKEGKEFIERADQMESELWKGLEIQEKNQLWDIDRKLLTQLTEMEREDKNIQEDLYHEKSFTAAQAV